MWAVRDAKGNTIAIYADEDEAVYYARRLGAGGYVVKIAPKRKNPRRKRKKNTRLTVRRAPVRAKDLHEEWNAGIPRLYRPGPSIYSPDGRYPVGGDPSQVPADWRRKKNSAKRRNPPRKINQKAYAYYVIANTARGPLIVAGNEYKSDALDAARDLPPTWKASAVVVSKATAVRRGLPPDSNSSWGP